MTPDSMTADVWCYEATWNEPPRPPSWRGPCRYGREKARKARIRKDSPCLGFGENRFIRLIRFIRSRCRARFAFLNPLFLSLAAWRFVSQRFCCCFCSGTPGGRALPEMQFLLGGFAFSCGAPYRISRTLLRLEGGSEGRIGGHGGQRFCQQLRGLLDIAQREGLDRSMHVAQRNADQ